MVWRDDDSSRRARRRPSSSHRKRRTQESRGISLRNLGKVGASMKSVCAHAIAMAALAGMAGCGNPPAAPDNSALSGQYVIEGTRILANGVGESREFRISIVKLTADGVVFDFTAGDIVSPLPARDTATVSGSWYYVQWNGNAQFNHSLYFRADSCQGNDIGGGGDTVAWAACAIHSISH